MPFDPLTQSEEYLVRLQFYGMGQADAWVILSETETATQKEDKLYEICVYDNIV